MILAIDTSTRSLSMALAGASGKSIRETFLVNEQPRHSAQLFRMLSKTTGKTSLKELTKIACTTGPGSFTGIRTGLCMARTISQSRGIPLVGVSTLDVLAHQSQENTNKYGYFICPLIPAQQENVFLAVYKSGKIKRLSAYSVININEIKIFFKRNSINSKHKIFFTGEGAVKYRNLLISFFPDCAMPASSDKSFPRASTLAFIAASQKGTAFRNVLPSYIQQPRIF